MLKTPKGELEPTLGHLALSVNQVRLVHTERHHDSELRIDVVDKVDVDLCMLVTDKMLVSSVF